ncbi:glycosyltransferase family 2 protein [Proteiniclasticum sp.]|uniref:glycosyltransferase n=1 Tax=Proteiniclasticum sp. TaxID=2053595 RepID=UPI00289E60CC|nr:glycosyltransferase family 2 protein [Proteiniclasticum sp.]
MNRDILDLFIAVTGLLSTAILFNHIPKLPEEKRKRSRIPSVSVIIPVRNEERNLPLLLSDLRNQSLIPKEIICVDDGSEDGTAVIAESYGVKLLTLENKPDGWLGKSWACQTGAEAAEGDLLLFIDADVRLGKDGVRRLVSGFSESEAAVSVQPFHKTEKVYEQFSLFFNLLQFAANGSALKKPINTGLNGPLILISRPDYDRVGGHRVIKSSVVDDVSLGLEMKRKNLPFSIFMGDEDISYRMYGEGLSSLLEGWTKNFAQGASKTPLFLFILVFLWVTSLTSVPLHLSAFLMSSKFDWALIYSLLYMTWVILLKVISAKIGRYHLWTTVFYPAVLLVFLGVFSLSVFKKVFGLKVTWKGRKIDTGEVP